MLGTDITDHPLTRAFAYATKLAECAFTDNTVIKLATPGHYAIVSQADADRVTSRSWYLHDTGAGLYARAWGPDGKRIYLHRVILGCTADQQIDHADGDKLNNSRSNLRLATNQQNSANRGPNKNNTTGYKGVIALRGRFRAQIMVNRRFKSLGMYDTAEEAARAHDRAARAAWGPFAWLNFPGDAE